VVNNLNSTLYENTQIQRHLQTGRKIINNYEDSGGLGSITRLNSTVLRNQAVQQNLQGSLSLLQAQDGMFKIIGNILDRSAELKTKFNSTMQNKHEKAYYDDEFTELQNELRQIAQSKWNGVSLFSTQDSKTLFGPAVDGQTINQESSDDGSGNTLALSRWGIHHEDPDSDPTPIKKKFLAMTLTDESEGVGSGQSYHPSSAQLTDLAKRAEGEQKFIDNIAEWKTFLDGENIEGEIAVVVNQRTNGNTGGKVLPYGKNDSDVTDYENQGLNATVYRGAGRDLRPPPNPGTATILPNGGDSDNAADQADYLFSIFQQHTNNGQDLPDVMGVFVDNSGSLTFPDVNQGLFLFLQKIRDAYGDDVVLPSETTNTISAPGDGQTGTLSKTGTFKGITLAGKEDWIHQSKIALENLINNDPNIAAAVQPTFGEPTYELDDYSIEDFEGFMESLATARAQNGAEQSRIKHELDELQTKQVGLEQALERADGLDYSLAMARYSKSRDQLHLTANLVSAAREMENILYTDFLNE